MSRVISLPPRRQVVKQLLLSCPGLHKGNELVRTCTGDALCDFLLNLTDTDCAIDDEWYYYLLREEVYGAENTDDDSDECRFIPGDNEQERWNFIRDPHGTLWQYGQQVDANLTKIVRFNEEAINQLYREVIANTIEVQRSLHNHLLLLIKGTDHDQLSFHTNSWY